MKSSQQLNSFAKFLSAFLRRFSKKCLRVQVKQQKTGCLVWFKEEKTAEKNNSKLKIFLILLVNPQKGLAIVQAAQI